MNSRLHTAAASASMLFLATVMVSGQTRYKVTTPIPSDITTPDKVDTRMGTLNFFDGVPTEETASKVYDQIDFSRGIWHG